MGEVMRYGSKTGFLTDCLVGVSKEVEAVPDLRKGARLDELEIERAELLRMNDTAVEC